MQHHGLGSHCLLRWTLSIYGLPIPLTGSVTRATPCAAAGHLNVSPSEEFLDLPLSPALFSPRSCPVSQGLTRHLSPNRHPKLYVGAPSTPSSRRETQGSEAKPQGQLFQDHNQGPATCPQWADILEVELKPLRSGTLGVSPSLTGDPESSIFLGLSSSEAASGEAWTRGPGTGERHKGTFVLLTVHSWPCCAASSHLGWTWCLQSCWTSQAPRAVPGGPGDPGVLGPSPVPRPFKVRACL
jgi:hypothetical protein